jgi:hypothetical protein
MHKPIKTILLQFPLFPPARVPSLPRVVDPQVLPLLAQLLRQHVHRTPATSARQEGTHE